ncbi:hypothetical protein LX69_01123 [Breznakibacter xylanolyticus]|uniref:Uncharacterized protein n=1 Tax=Breznakibacter xylanolyticus TaxID=990 RepID=A0A2W7NXT3_9BACT|nr:hypothetical protein [Breznakibacter xylanolyticus]PZX18086.1 hypothetical protein LX69_01123 [Breznakibacter xylanolyticus]
MTYIERINMFWVLHEGNQYSTTEIALYFYLMKVANICGWPDSFKRNNAKICSDLGVSFKTLANARNRLKQTNAIDFKTTNGAANVSYTFGEFTRVSAEVEEEVKTLGKFTKVSAKVSAEVRAEVGAEVGDELNKRKEERLDKKKEEPPSSPKGELFPEEDNETKEMTPAPKKKKKAEVLDKSFIPTAYLALVEDWIAYRKTIGKPYKTQFGLTQFVKKLVEISGDNLIKAKQIVEHAKGKEWQDVYPINQDKKQGAQRAGQILQPKDETHKSDLLKRFNNGNTSSN